MPKLQRLVPVVLLAACGVAEARPPEQRPDNLIDDRFGLQASLMYSSSSTVARLDATDGTLGTEFNAEDDLGLPKSELIARGEAWFRMRERHRARIGTYFIPLDRTGTTTLTRDISFGDETFLTGEEVTSRIKLEVFSLTYVYSVIRNERVEAGISLGFDVVGFEAEASVPSRLRTEREERSGPAPRAGLEATFRINPRFYAEARGQYVKVDIDDVEGSLLAYELNVLYRMTPNITFGLGFLGLDVAVDSMNPGDTGKFDLSTTAPQLFARVGF